MAAPTLHGEPHAERRQGVARAPSIGLAVGGLVIAQATIISVDVLGAPSWSMAAFAALGLAFLAPLMTRWPVTRRRATWTAVGWLLIGGLLVMPLFWSGFGLILGAAMVASIPTLIGVGVGWD